MFDLSPAHILILLLVVILLFGSRRLPGAAKSLGESMHIFKKSVSGLNEDGTPKDGSQPQAQATAQPQAAILPAAPAPAAPEGATAQQLADLQRQVQDLQKQNAAAGSSTGDETF